MHKVSLKTRVLNKFRAVGKLLTIERALVRITQNRTPQNFSVKIIPNNYQYAKNSMRNCERDGIHYSLDISDYMQYCIYYGIKSEPREKLYNLVRNGTTIVDVGTNFGETLLHFAKLNKNGQNIGFEPVPFLFERARQHVELNKFENVVLENLALSNENAELTFHLKNEYNSGGIFLTDDVKNKDASQIVQAIRLDDYILEKQLKEISLIKIDVEGFEMNVLRGAVTTLEQLRPSLFVEVNDAFLRRQQSSAKAMIEFLQSYDYQIFYAENEMPVSADDDFAGKHFDVIGIVHHG